MLLVYATAGWRKPAVFRNLAAAQAHVIADMGATAEENPEWYEHSDRWVVTFRWRSQQGILWKVEQ